MFALWSASSVFFVIDGLVVIFAQDYSVGFKTFVGIAAVISYLAANLVGFFYFNNFRQKAALEGASPHMPLLADTI